jgi:hypothetical protein
MFPPLKNKIYHTFAGYFKHNIYYATDLCIGAVVDLSATAES